MASDAYVKELTCLYSLRSDLLGVAGSVRGALSSVAQSTYSEESEIYGLYSQVESRCGQCRDNLYAAEREYESYCNNTDPENYSSSVAEDLRRDVEQARQQLLQAEQNLQQAQNLVVKARQLLSGINGMAQSAASYIDAEAGKIAFAIEQAAHEIDKYTN